MATDVREIVNVPEDDDIFVLRVTPAPIKKGTSKIDAIPVENYPLRPKKVIDLSLNSYFDDEVQLLHSLPKPRRVILKGEFSNSKGPSKIESLTFMCEICADEKPRSELFRILGCDHSYCSECMGKYVASKLQENITSISCPVLGCAGFLEPQHCRSILPKQVFDRWGDVLCEAVILASEKFYCPFKDCSALLIDDMCVGTGSDVVVHSECPDCHRLFCVRCKVPWHVGVSCEEFQKLREDERSNEDIMLMKLAKANKWMRCSKCRYHVEKSDGCLFMRCRCGHTFCYNCGASIKDHYCYKCKH